MKVIKLKSFDLLKKKTNKEIINQSINIKIKKDIKNLSPVKIKLSLLKKQMLIYFLDTFPMALPQLRAIFNNSLMLNGTYNILSFAFGFTNKVRANL